MELPQINSTLQQALADARANAGDGTALSEKRKASSAFLKALAKKNGMSVGKNRDSLEKIGGYIRWHGSAAASRVQAKGKKGKAKKG